MENSDLQALVNAYHGGQLNRHEYRRLRRELVDRLVEQDSASLADEQTSPATVPHYISKGQSHLPSTSTKTSKIGWTLSVIAVAAIIAGYVYFSHNMSGVVSPPVQSESPSAMQALTTATSAPWLDELIAAAVWDQSRINEFLRHWETLDGDQRQEIRDTPQFHRLTDILSRHLAEQRALAELNNKQAQQQQARLQALMRALQK
jgi:hypothetical protein